MSNFFFAYPGRPEQLGEVVESAISKFNFPSNNTLLSWRAMDIAGNFIPEEILKQISQKTLIADITTLNINVVYEIGYAIGQKRFLLLVRNSSIKENRPTIQEVGIFDTLGYQEYQNSEELHDLIFKNKSNQTFKGEEKLSLTTPVYIMGTQFKTDLSSRILSRIRKASFYYRTFDPAELPRLSAYDAIKNVSESYGVIVQFISRESRNSDIHNIRAAFIAGLADGMEIPVKIIQQGFDPVPVDLRDKVDVIHRIEDVDKIITEFVHEVMTGIQEYSATKKENPSILESLDLGASAAENESRNLQSYYLSTDSFFKALKGEVQLVIGRKGTGKSAIFYQIINKEKPRSKSIVIDLQPEGYKLIKLKEQIADRLEEGTFQHTITAFWEYILLLEVAIKILEIDKSRHISNDLLREDYINLEGIMHAEQEMNSGDFSDRMTFLIQRILTKISNLPKTGQLRLSSPEITSLIHSSSIKELKQAILKYLKHKEKVWILFDNLDKGWPASGLTTYDIVIIRSLIEASNRLKRFFEKSDIDLFPVIFLRSDVYHQLVLGTPDRQKEAKVSLDWTDKDLLARIIELRVKSNESLDKDDSDFTKLWRQLVSSHFKGEDSLHYIIERCLMRPRFLINFINHCRSYAVNLGHNKITEDDISKGFATFSADILTDINLEIQDVFPAYGDILSSFYLSPNKLNKKELYELIGRTTNDAIKTEAIIETLLWYGFLGIWISDEDTSYIYNVNYNIDLLKAMIKNRGEMSVYIINPAFEPSLHLLSSTG